MQATSNHDAVTKTRAYNRQLFNTGRTNSDASFSRIYTQRDQCKLPEVWLLGAFHWLVSLKTLCEHFQLVIECSVPYNLMSSGETKISC